MEGTGAYRVSGWIIGVVLALGASGSLARVEAQIEESPPPAGLEDDCEGDVAWEDRAREIELGQSRGGLLLRSRTAGRYWEAPTLDTEVELTVSGLILRGRVSQRFTNPTSGWQEGIYVFPLPETAAVDTLRMRIGERVIEGQIKERKEAKRIYQEAKSEGRKASLVEQERPNLFTNSVANIAPGEEVEVTLEYQQTLRYDAGRFRLRFPMVVGPRYIPGQALSPEDPEGGPVIFDGSGWAAATDQVPDAARITPPVLAPSSPRENRLSLEVDLEPGFELAELDSPYHPIDIEEPSSGQYRVRLAEESVLADRDFELVWRPRPAEIPRAALFTQELDGEVYALLMVLPPQEASAPRLPRELILVIDTSGSMHGASIYQAREALHEALGSLEAGDRFNVIRFHTATSALFDSAQPVTGSSLAAARSYVDGLEAEGGTNMLPALELALSDGPQGGRLRQVVFMTDGAVGNEEELFQFISHNLGENRLFTVGIGSAPNAHFMNRAASFGRGTFTYIGSPEEVREKMSELFAKLESPHLAGIEIGWPDPSAEVWPREIPDLYLGEPVVVAARLPGLGGQAVVRGRRGQSPWQVPLELRGGAESPGIDKLWARRKIAALMDRQTQGAEVGEIRRQVVEVALAHHLVSKYTSLVAVDVTPERPMDEALATHAVPTHLPEGWSPAHVAGTLPQGATPAPLLLLVGLLLAALAAGLRWRTAAR
ncbi:MAG: marine proteobacterial sortase target protein [Acidobacteria bacterium]|nr:marine proteobacterial sortase target protein [Acidobacteriota bacterium]